MPADESLEVVASGSIKFHLQEMGKWRTKWKIKINTVRLGNVIFTLKKKTTRVLQYTMNNNQNYSD